MAHKYESYNSAMTITKMNKLFMFKQLKKYINLLLWKKIKQVLCNKNILTLLLCGFSASCHPPLAEKYI